MRARPGPRNEQKRQVVFRRAWCGALPTLREPSGELEGPLGSPRELARLTPRPGLKKWTCSGESGILVVHFEPLWPIRNLLDFKIQFKIVV